MQEIVTYEKGLSEQQLACIEHLIAGKTKSAAAEAVGVAAYSVSRWFKEAEFVAALNRRRLEAHEASVERLRAMVSKALAVYEDALDSENPKVRLQVAGLVLQAAGLTGLPQLSGKTDAGQLETEWSRQEALRLAQQGMSELLREMNIRR